MSGCPKSDVKPIECIPYFEDITMKMEERRCDLIGRRKHLREKISTMERSIPALIAYNMWMAKDKCDDAPTCKVREIMKKFSTHPDPTEKLLANLKKSVKELNGETAELHEKIIQADVKLEETDMELDSLELLNKEMNEKLTSLEREVKSFTTPSLHSIHSEDLICLSKIRQLAKDELCLKQCIKQMELKETLFKEHMDRLLTCREYQNAFDKRKMAGCLQNMDCSGRIVCEPKKCMLYKSAGQRLKKKLGHEDREVLNESEKTQTQSDAIVSTSEHDAGKQDKSQATMEKKTSWIPNWFSGQQKSTEDVPPPKDDNIISIPTEENNEPGKPVTVEAATQPDSPKERPKEKVISDKLSKKPGHASPSCKPCARQACPPAVAKKSRSRKGKERLCAGKFITPCNIPFMKSCKGFPSPTMPRKPCFDVSCCLADHGIKKPCKLYMPTCDLGGTCEICPMSYKECFRPPNNCRCNCRGKCAKGLSEAECNCSDALLDPLDVYQPTAAQLHVDPNSEDSNSDDDFCECCSCGCEDSDGSFSCQCN